MFQNLVESIPEASGLQNGLMSIAAHNAATVYKDIPLNGNITESGAYVASFASYMPTSDYYVIIAYRIRGYLLNIAVSLNEQEMYYRASPNPMPQYWGWRKIHYS